MDGSCCWGEASLHWTHFDLQTASANSALTLNAPLLSSNGQRLRTHRFERIDLHKVKHRKYLRTYGVKLVVDYSRLANTHPAGVRRTVLKLPLNEEYGVHPRICSNHLTG